MKLIFPDNLPVSQRRDDIREAIAAHPVVIVCGDTGSGKTTQLPKIALELGLGQKGRRIGCTQPRRLAATSVARRVAEDLGVPLGQEVGYQIRFDDRTDKKSTRVKFMTDGILLAETQNDPLLKQYDTLIIDEAHERSLNIDFILGYLQRTLTKRQDLKVIISSATLDAGAFADFFDGAPIIEVEGRTFPVEDLYQEPLDDREPLPDQVARAVEDLGKQDPLGDTLVFLPGEREIRDVAELLEGRQYPGTVILPLFARQAGEEQQSVFNPLPSRRRVILATNVAETSLTIPDIRSVVDSGIARISRYDTGSGIQRLQIEGISKASARQRRGRCGRVSEGVCVRLYSEEDFEERPDYTDPEILRSNLSGVVLQMEHLRLGDPLKFPFVNPPQPKRIAQAYRVLEEIGAIEKKGQRSGLTDIGRTLARLPLDPRVGRILIGAEKEGCLLEGLIVASALTVQDPRERPKEKQDVATGAHRKFHDKRSDFTGWLRWWHGIQEARDKSNNQLRRFCQKNFLNYRRVQEWLNLHRELRDSLRDLRWKLPSPKKRIEDPADTYSEPLHRAILAAIPSQIGMHQGKAKGYKGSRSNAFFIFPGSGVFSSSPAWVMAFEVVETSKLYARNVAMFDPGYYEKVAPHLCRYSYTNPHWVEEQGAVYGEERVIAFGLPVVEKRRIHYGRINRAVAREIFILEALVNGRTRAPMPALAKNRETMSAAERLEHKVRRLGGMLHPEAIVAFYEERLPEDVCTQKQFEKWATQAVPGAIDFTLEDCLIPQVEPLRVDDFPDQIDSSDGAYAFSLTYLHNPSDAGDGITAEIPLSELLHLPAWFGDWLVVGWLAEKVGVLLRCLRKETRTLLPANREVVEGFIEAWEGYEPDCSLIDALIDYLAAEYELELTEASFDLDRVPNHLQMRFTVVDDKGKVIGQSRDLKALQQGLADRVKSRFATVSQGKFEREAVGSWSFGDLPEEVALDRRTVGYPRLYDPGRELPSLKLFSDQVCAERQHQLGLAKLYAAVSAEKVTELRAQLFNASTGSQAAPKRQATRKEVGNDFGSVASAFGALDGGASPQVETKPSTGASGAVSKLAFLTAEQGLTLSHFGPDPRRNREDLIHRAIMNLLERPMKKTEWEAQVKRVDKGLFEETANLCRSVAKLIPIAERMGELLSTEEPGYEESLHDAQRQYADLLAPGWLLVGDITKRLIHWQGLEMRLTRMLGAPPAKDLQKLERYQEKAGPLWSEEAGCECGHCPKALIKQQMLAQDFDLRLKSFAPEIWARMK